MNEKLEALRVQNPDLVTMFEKEASAFSDNRMKKSIEESIRRYLGEILRQTLLGKINNPQQVSVTIKTGGNFITEFEMDAKDDSYPAWRLAVNIRPFMVNYQEWMYGQNQEWKNHVKLFSR